MTSSSQNGVDQLQASNLELETRNDTTSSSLSESPELSINIEGLVGTVEPRTKCCIYKVPRSLRKINEEAYTPQLVSIGPLHHSKERYLIEMDRQKLEYAQKFTGRPSMESLEEFRSYIKHNEKKIRGCYAEELYFLSDDFVEMILHDVVFIFELFLRSNEREFDVLLHTPIRRVALELDLQLLENQLPYFVLKELFLMSRHLVESSQGEHFSDPFLILALRFFFGRDHDHLTDSTYNLQHFTDLRRRFLLKGFSPPNYSPYNQMRDLPCATKLHRSGVKFESSVKGGSSLEISCKYIKRPLQMIPCIKLEVLVLEIPRLDVNDGTECLIRNVMAFEQLHCPFKTCVCDYVVLMDFLIDTEKDVDLLVEKGIILNCVGENAAIANMFNKLGSHVAPMNSCYHDIHEKLKAHYGKRWNHAKATLTNVYFSDPWIATGTVAAAILLLLTLVQTVCSILQVVL